MLREIWSSGAGDILGVLHIARHFVANVLAVPGRVHNLSGGVTNACKQTGGVVEGPWIILSSDRRLQSPVFECVGQNPRSHAIR